MQDILLVLPPDRSDVQIAAPTSEINYFIYSCGAMGPVLNTFPLGKYNSEHSF